MRARKTDGRWRWRRPPPPADEDGAEAAGTGPTRAAPVTQGLIARGKRVLDSLREKTSIRPDAEQEIEAAIGSPGKTLTLKYEESRQWAILAGWRVQFNIEDNPKADAGSPSDWNHDEGARVLRTHDHAIDKEARAQGVDPDLVRAIMYVENSGGDDTYFAASDFFERVGVADSIRPMNIKPEVWSGLGYDEEDFSKPEKNIEAAVKLIKGIQDRLDPKDQTPAKIGSIYNYTGRELVNDYGARVQDVYDKKLWTKVGLE